jgi:hypothetical protein
VVVIGSALGSIKPMSSDEVPASLPTPRMYSLRLRKLDVLEVTYHDAANGGDILRKLDVLTFKNVLLPVPVCSTI